MRKALREVKNVMYQYNDVELRVSIDKSIKLEINNCLCTLSFILPFELDIFI